MAEVSFAPGVVDSILKAGKWTVTADDTEHSELLPEEVVRALVRGHRQRPDDPAALASVGLLALAMGAGRWGVAWKDLAQAPDDPAGVKWKGPDAVKVGKHVMSYTIGGIGLPHLDRGSAIDFFDEVISKVPAAASDLNKLKPGFVYDAVRNAEGPNWDNLQKSESRRIAPPRRPGMDPEILGHFLPAHEAVMNDPSGTIEEAFVVARIWNTAPGDGQQALAAAKGRKTPADRIKAELGTYRKKDRHGVMQRAGAVYSFFQ